MPILRLNIENAGLGSAIDINFKIFYDGKKIDYLSEIYNSLLENKKSKKYMKYLLPIIDNSDAKGGMAILSSNIHTIFEIAVRSDLLDYLRENNIETSHYIPKMQGIFLDEMEKVKIQISYKDVYENIYNKNISLSVKKQQIKISYK